MIVGIHHAQITIPKGMEDAARDFYCGVLGLKKIEKPETLNGRGGFWLKVGELELHVGTEDSAERANTKAHVAYQVNDISYWKETLRKNNTEILTSIAIPSYDRFEFRDPFGNRVEMIQSI
ncbi:VOC family protein [Oceanobacillus sp. CAU 1775]